MSSEKVQRAKRQRQCLPDEPVPSIRVRAAVVLSCRSVSDEGVVCGEMARFEHDKPDGAIALAREDGWTFRAMAARCPRCGCLGRAFGREEYRT